jgi:Fic family protein
MKIIHIGDTSEEMILSHITDLINFMNKNDIQSLVKASIAHYYFEYIHPFYDGNGRFGRLLFSMYLARKTDIFTALSLSYSIFSDKVKYSKLFLDVSNPRNCGEMTFFVKGMLEFILKGQDSILEMLNEKSIKLNFALQYIKDFDLTEIESRIVSIYIQDYIFTERSHMKDSEILEYLPIKSKLTLKKHINSLIEKGYLEQICKRPSQHSLSESLKGELE